MSKFRTIQTAVQLAIGTVLLALVLRTWLVMGLVAGLLIPRQAPTAPALTVTDGERYFVERVVDGDTIHLKIGIRVRYMHSDIDTIERIEILRDLRLGAYDVVIGVNLLRHELAEQFSAITREMERRQRQRISR
ncbi:MAG: hypothetical protein IH831_04635 [Planctomycetes bacterium]|nr:hypothetical protein [Planctomycetota bacterium]